MNEYPRTKMDLSIREVGGELYDAFEVKVFSLSFCASTHFIAAFDRNHGHQVEALHNWPRSAADGILHLFCKLPFRQNRCFAGEVVVIGTYSVPGDL